MSQPQAESRARSSTPWHMRVVTIYLLLFGFWTWGWLCYVNIVHKVPVGPYAGIYARGVVLAAVCLAAAYAMYRKSRFAVLFIAAAPIAQWLGFAALLPNTVGDTSQIDFAYIRQLPPMLLANFALFSAMTLYSLMLCKYKRLA